MFNKTEPSADESQQKPDSCESLNEVNSSVGSSLRSDNDDQDDNEVQLESSDSEDEYYAATLTKQSIQHANSCDNVDSVNVGGESLFHDIAYNDPEASHPSNRKKSKSFSVSSRLGSVLSFLPAGKNSREHQILQDNFESEAASPKQTPSKESHDSMNLDKEELIYRNDIELQDQEEELPQASNDSSTTKQKYSFNLQDREVTIRDDSDDDIETIVRPSLQRVYNADDEMTSFLKVQHELDVQHEQQQQQKSEHSDLSSEYSDASSAIPMVELPADMMEEMVKDDPNYKEGFFESLFVLRNFSETPRFLRRPFILSGYRVQFSVRMCLHSLFRLHNETFNVWTHLSSFILLSLLCVVTLVTVITVGIQREHPTITLVGDAVALLTYMLAANYCFFCSSMYHCFKCRSKHSYCNCYRMDISGISLLIAASFIPGLWFLMRCNMVLQAGYGIIVCILALAGTLMPFSCLFSTRIFESLRTLFFLGMIFFSIFPSVHFTIQEIILGKIDAIYFEFLCGFFVMVSCYAIGFTFWMTRFPERLFPGKFDIFFSSHQIWHTFISLGVFVWWGFAMRLWWVKGRVKCW